MENWELVKSAPGCEVSTNGRVRGASGKILKCTPRPSGYVSVVLCGEKNQAVLVHRLVADAFIPNPNGLPQVDHIDRNRSNNRAENLRWVSRQQNASNKEPSGKPPSRNRSIVQLTSDGDFVQVWGSITAAAASMNMSRQQIDKCLYGKGRTAGGYKWKYRDDYEQVHGEEWQNTKHRGVEFTVSNLGRVRCASGKITLGASRDDGYRSVDREKKAFLVHRLVASAWVENPDPGTKILVNHKDGNRSNNNASNLEWVTPSENTRAAVLMGSVSTVSVKRTGGRAGDKIYPSIRDASRDTETDYTSICRCLSGRAKTAGGFYWTRVSASLPREPAAPTIVSDDDPIWAELGL